MATDWGDLPGREHLEALEKWLDAVDAQLGDLTMGDWFAAYVQGRRLLFDIAFQFEMSKAGGGKKSLITPVVPTVKGPIKA